MADTTETEKAPKSPKKKRAKKVHWTKTKEGKEKLSNALKAFHAGKGKTPKGTKKRAAKTINPLTKSRRNAASHEEIPSDLLSYVAGRFDSLIEQFAQSANVSANALAVAVAGHLSTRPGR